VVDVLNEAWADALPAKRREEDGVGDVAITQAQLDTALHALRIPLR
jgi:hypothetical protein